MIKNSGVKLKRDIVLAFTGDEESGGSGIKAVLEKHPEWLDVEIGLNEGGSLIQDESGKMKFINLGVAEKTYQDFALTVKGTTGHSSIPKGDNAIYLMTAALERLSKYKFEEQLLPAIREYFLKRAPIEKPEIGKAMLQIANAKGKLPQKAIAVLKENPTLAGNLFTTCVPTMINGGIRANALPPDVVVNVNCRILPGEPIANVQRRLEQVLKDPRIVIKEKSEFGIGGMSAFKGVIPDAVKKISREMFGDIPVMTSMLAGGTDSRFLRTRDVQMYGLQPIPGLEADGARSHGIDERIPISGLRTSLEFEYRLVMELAQ